MQYIRPENRAPEAISTREILDSLYRRPQCQAADHAPSFPVKEFLLGFLLTMALYYPIVRGYCWLVLVLAYAFGVDSVWPGPYTPFPSQF